MTIIFAIVSLLLFII